MLEVSQINRKLEATAAEYFEEVLEIVAETVGENIKHLASSAEQGMAMEGKLVELKGNACQLIKMCTSSVVNIL